MRFISCFSDGEAAAAALDLLTNGGTTDVSFESFDPVPNDLYVKCCDMEAVALQTYLSIAPDVRTAVEEKRREQGAPRFVNLDEKAGDFDNLDDRIGDVADHLADLLEENGITTPCSTLDNVKDLVALDRLACEHDLNPYHFIWDAVEHDADGRSATTDSLVITSGTAGILAYGERLARNYLIYDVPTWSDWHWKHWGTYDDIAWHQEIEPDDSFIWLTTIGSAPLNAAHRLAMATKGPIALLYANENINGHIGYAIFTPQGRAMEISTRTMRIERFEAFVLWCYLNDQDQVSCRWDPENQRPVKLEGPDADDLEKRYPAFDKDEFFDLEIKIDDLMADARDK